MTSYIYYGVGHTGVAISIISFLYFLMKYIFIRKNKDVFLDSWIFFVGTIALLLPTIFVIFSDFIMHNKYATMNSKMVAATIYIVISWIIGIYLLMICSHYYLKIEEDKLIIHSIYFSIKVLMFNEINKKKSFLVIADKTIMDEYFIIYYEGKYYKFCYDFQAHTACNRKFVEWCTKMNFRRITQKNEFNRFKKSIKMISLGRVFIKRK